MWHRPSDYADCMDLLLVFFYNQPTLPPLPTPHNGWWYLLVEPLCEIACLTFCMLCQRKPCWPFHILQVIFLLCAAFSAIWKTVYPSHSSIAVFSVFAVANFCTCVVVFGFVCLPSPPFLFVLLFWFVFHYHGLHLTSHLSMPSKNVKQPVLRYFFSLTEIHPDFQIVD